ncbi:MAG: UbiX family flavin prenyltransferase, partial [Thermoplasmata archaeon]|nr:UbiX family flavin prenyltransferase [Thermoplasmata archaeon]
MRIAVCVTGASGAPYAYRLLQALKGRAELVLSQDAEEVIRAETGRTPKDFRSLAAAWYRNDDFRAPFASGSAPLDAVVIVPCSMNTLSKVALGLSDNLITRAAAVALKEGRKLVLVPRETPLSAIHLEHMLTVARLGGTVLPAMPGFYH